MGIKKSIIAGFIGSLSLGIVIIFAQIWFYSQATTLFPDNSDIWQIRIGAYILMTIAIFGWDAIGRKTEKELFNISFLKALPVLAISFVVSYLALWVIGVFVLGNSVGLIASLGLIPIPILLFHVLIVSIDEELIFRGAIAEYLKGKKATISEIFIASSILFAIFHFAMAGGELLLLIPYFLLGLIFMWIKNKYSPKTNMANSGTHMGWNMAILTGLLGA